MAAKTVAQKLQIRPGSSLALLNAPAHYAEALAPLPEGAAIVEDPAGRFPVVLLFAHNRAELEANVRRALGNLAEDAILWVAYPKKSSKLNTDLDRDEGWISLTREGYRAVAQIALDDTWAAVRFRPYVAKPPADVIAGHFAGPKAALRPLYDQLAAVLTGLGTDVQVVPRQSYIAFGRGRQFVQVRAAARDRLEVAMKLPNPPDDPRLQPLSGAGGGMPHKVDLTPGDRVDPELLAWLADAYAAAA